ncbi:MAG: hypothetical protein KDI46_01450 [Alphaproteobacteria bacterium]|nr:hypothetical protein [Alphaproteobacteria bacterium]
MNKNLSRAELYDLVWSEPMHKLARKFKMSDRGLAKACGKYDIPVPPRGYWNKKQAGHKVVKRALPRRALGMSDRISFGHGWHYGYRASNDEDIDMPLPPAPEFEPSMEEVRREAEKIVAKASFPKSMSSPHRLIGTLLAEDEKRREKCRTTPYASLWDQPYFNSPFEKRRLRILNALFIGISKCGMKPECDRKRARSTLIVVGEQTVFFTLDSVNVGKDQHEHEERYSFKARGDKDRMVLRLGNYYTKRGDAKSWEDTEDRKIEDCFKEIAAEIIVAAEQYYRDRELELYEWRVQRREEMIEERKQRLIEEERSRKERLKKLEQDRVDHLLGQAQAYRQACDIRAFIETVNAACKGGDLSVSDNDLRDWTAWANDQADSLDPVSSGRFTMRPNAEEEE